MALLTQSEAEQSNQGNPGQLALQYSGENNVNITPRTEVKEVKVPKSDRVPKARWQQLMGYLDNAGNTWGGQISHKAMEKAARVSTVGADIISDIKQAVKPQSPKRIISKGGTFLKQNQRKKYQSF